MQIRELRRKHKARLREGKMLMLTIFACLLLLASVLLLMQAGWALIITLGYRRENTVRVNAWMDRTKYTPKINVHDKWGRYIHCHTQVWYFPSYCDSGKPGGALWYYAAERSRI